MLNLRTEAEEDAAVLSRPPSALVRGEGMPAAKDVAVRTLCCLRIVLLWLMRRMPSVVEVSGCVGSLRRAASFPQHCWRPSRLCMRGCIVHRCVAQSCVSDVLL